MLENIVPRFSNALKGILYSLDYFKLIQILNWYIIKGVVNTIHIFNIDLAYETCKHLKKYWMLMVLKLDANGAIIPQ